MAYSDAFKNEALIQLVYNKYNYKLTAQQMSERTGQNVTVRTLRNWEKNFPKNTVPKLLERTISRLLANLPATVPAKDYGVILGILLDKWLLLEGKPTSRTEGVVRRLADMSDEEWDAVQNEMERILTGADSSSDAAGS